MGERVTAVSASVSLETRLKAHAYALGFDHAGIALLGAAETYPEFESWLARGYDGEMGYLGRGAEKRRDTSLPYVGARSAIVVALDYGGREQGGPVARYARGDDYHDVMVARLRELHAWLNASIGREIPGKAYVDTGPILERDLARRAGIGWFGKNTNLINPRTGSFFFLGSLLVAHDLVPDAPFEADRCGTCTRCLDACPTQAFTAPRSLDATRCISYLTIEQRGSIAEELRPLVGEWLYGCDVCQEVCPWNVSFATELREEALRPRELLLDAGSREGTRALAREILMMEPADYAAAFKRSAIKRAKLWMLQRNACVVLANVGTDEDLAVLEAMVAHAHEVVREHAAWAAARIARHPPR